MTGFAADKFRSSHRPDSSLYDGQRGICGKRRYRSRKQARAATSELRHRESGMRAYECPSCGPGNWHIGHLPGSVRGGHLSAGAMYS